MYKLVISDDEGKNTVVPLVRDEITIGRKEGNTIRLTERNVSRKHARISRSNGAYIVEDLSSYNGIRLNGRRIDAQAELHAGDQIVIGDYILALQQEEVAQAATAPAVQGQAREAVPSLKAPPPVAEPKPLEAEDTALTNVMAPKAEPRPPARLVLIYPPPIGAEFALTAPRLRIGRAEHLDVCINHRSISREHAELVQQGDAYRVIDLASANGVRINGDDIQNAIVSPGDVLELGQVRLKFVGEGEAYRAEDDPAAKAPPGALKTSSRAPVWIAGAIIAGALGYAIYVATGGSPRGDVQDGSLAPQQDDPNVIADVAPPSNNVQAEAGNANPTAETNSAAAFSTALTACETEVQSSEFASAVAHAATALQLRPNDTNANRCLRVATEGVTDQQTFERGRTSLAAGDVAQAHEAFATLSPNSVFRGRPEFLDAERRFQEAQVRVAAVETPRQATTTPRNTAPANPRAPRNPAAANPRTNDNQQVVAPANGQVPANPYEETPAAAAPSRLDQARQCAVQGDNQCVVDQLAGHARSEVEMSLLIETYRQMGNNNAAIPLMRRYVERFPTTNRARQYQQVLVHYGE